MYCQIAGYLLQSMHSLIFFRSLPLTLFELFLRCNPAWKVWRAKGEEKKTGARNTWCEKKKKSLCWLMDELVQREGERKKERRVWEGSRLLIKHWGSSVSCPETEWISSQNRIELITNDEGFSFEGAPDTHTWYRVYQHHLHSASHFLNSCGGDT